MLVRSIKNSTVRVIGSIFNDFQHILNDDSSIPKCPRHDMWSSALEEDLVNLRNWMNLTHELRLGKEFQGMSVYLTLEWEY
jgi:hypothetical protein